MTSNAIAKPSAKEDELVRRIHRAVGGPAKLSTYDDPAAVREVVIRALASEQRLTQPEAADRIARGELTAFERRVVRTVTNRGAAVRSRMRQRKELARLREELRKKDLRLAQLESALQSITARFQLPMSPVTPPHTYAPPTLAIPSSSSASTSMTTEPIEDEHNTKGRSPMSSVNDEPTSIPGLHTAKVETSLAPLPPPPPPPSSTIQLPPELHDDTTPMLSESADRDIFGSLVDKLISPLS